MQATKLPRVKELNEKYVQVLAHKQSLYKDYWDAKKEMQDYVTAKHNVDTSLASEREKKEKSLERNKKENTTR